VRRPALRAAGLAASLVAASLAWGQASKPGPAQPLDGAAALSHLNLVVDWYRRASTDIPVLGLPSEVIYQEQTQALGVQVVRLAFQSARAEAGLIRAQAASMPAGKAPGADDPAQRRAQAEARTEAQVKSLQDQAAALENQIRSTPAARRIGLETQLERTQSQLDLQQAILDAIRKMASFAQNSNGPAGGLDDGIEQLARSIPEVEGKGAEPPKPPGAGPASPLFSNSGGLLKQFSSLLDCISAVRQIDLVLQRTAQLGRQVDALRTPLRTDLRATLQASQDQGAPQAQANADPAALSAAIQADRALTERFRQLTGALLPLSEELILLDDLKANLGRWRELDRKAAGYVLRSVLIRAAVILVALGLILGLSEGWRRVTFRYVKEPRRRRQFLVMRRVVSGFLMTLVVILGFVTQFSSLATFAGFITAGIAVGLQAVLLSVAAYFLIIGRYGIRVGDRVSIAGITGDVVDVGLVRFYLLELAGTGLDFRPTGRIVVLSNAVLFQAGTPLFKQIPGTEYAWHEIVLALAPGGDHQALQARLMRSVEAVCAEHRSEIERQGDSAERRVDIQIEFPQPEARLQFTDAGPELVARYPVAIRKAREIDEQVTREVLGLIEADPDLKAAVTGTPKIRSLLKA